MNFEYRYTARDGSTVSIKPNEHYILVAKTNENWWHVRRDEKAKPFFIPARYVTELPAENSQTPLDPPEEFSGRDASDGTAEVTLREPASIKRDTEKDGHRISTYIIPKEFFQPKVWDTGDLQPELHIYDTAQGIARENNHSPPANGETSQSIFLPHDDTVNTRTSVSEHLQRVTDKDSGVYDNIDTMTKPESPHTENNSTEMVKLSSSATSNPPDQSTVRKTVFSSLLLLSYIKHTDVFFRRTLLARSYLPVCVWLAG